MSSQHRPRPIVVGVDESASSRVALHWAAELAAATGAPLLLLHAQLHGSANLAAAPLRPYMRELLADAERCGVDRPSVEVVHGNTVDLLHMRAGEARLLVLGSYGDGAWSGTLVGHVALGLAGRVGCPVAVVRGATPGVPPSRRGAVVAAVEDLGTGPGVLDTALLLARAWGTSVLVAHCAADGGPAGSVPRGDAAATARRLVDWGMRWVSDQDSDVPVAGEVIESGTGQGLMDLATSARVIVVGHHPQPSSAPSTMRRLIEFAPCPIVAVPLLADPFVVTDPDHAPAVPPVSSSR
ncbi:universal stress protein [Pseudonocardia sp. N23]|uniref:universal stress protein n=1 Tax=Pseudonocardia sp. N23 TaxID=1987376 RepID=UPI000BFB5880|nr:universal stress protein [Pseudonocardia sp. N23]GAY07310.1 universal stress protein family [Pseudonocardia sp. N23]